MLKKRLVNHIKKEYWEDICPICDSIGTPEIQCFDDGKKIHIRLSCPKCDLTISYKMPRVQHKARKGSHLFQLIPNIFHSP